MRMKWSPDPDFLAGYAVGLVTMLLLQFLYGCDIQTPNNTEVDPPANSQDVAEWVAGEWATRFDLPDDYQIPPIRYFEGECLTYPMLPDSGCMTGRYWSGIGWTAQEIHLIIQPGMWDTSITHELLHWVKDEYLGGSDPWHNGDYWDEVRPLELRMCDYLNPGATCVWSDTADPRPRWPQHRADLL